MIIPVINGTTGIVTKDIEKNSEAIPGKHSMCVCIYIVQKTATLGTHSTDSAQKTATLETYSVDSAQTRSHTRNITNSREVLQSET